MTAGGVVRLKIAYALTVIAAAAGLGIGLDAVCVTSAYSGKTPPTTRAGANVHQPGGIRAAVNDVNSLMGRRHRPRRWSGSARPGGRR